MPEQTRKKLISLRVDPEVLDFFKAQGPGYQTRMNAVLHGLHAGQERADQTETLA